MARKVSDEQCVAVYERFGHLGQAAAEIGIHKSSLHGRLVRLGVSTARARAWSGQDDELLRKKYSEFRVAGKVRLLAQEMDRTVGAICQRAYSLGLTDANARSAIVVPSEAEYFRRSADDRYSAASMLMSIGGTEERVEIHVLDGDPMSKARSRFSSKTGAFTPASVREAEGRWASRLNGTQKFTGNVAVAAIFVRATAQRIDVDNMLKLVLDASTKAGVWDDDSQVTALCGRVELDPFDPRTIVAFAGHASSLMRGSDHWPICPTCELRFNPNSKRSVFCSAKCRAERMPKSKT